MRSDGSRSNNHVTFTSLQYPCHPAVLRRVDKSAATILRRLRWGASFLVLLILVTQVIPRALGQRDTSKRSWDVKIPWLKHPAGCSSWTPTGSLNTARDSHTATVLPNGMVLVA